VRPDEVPAIEFPPGVHPDLSDLNHNAYRLPGQWGAKYRRAITADSPLKFAITYFPDWLVQEDSFRMSFCRLHLELCLAAKEWIRPGPSRHAWIAPRNAGKSRWLFGILPIWAMAFGYRDYVTAFAYTKEQAANHLANILDRLKEPDSLLLADFPELAPARGKGGPGRTVLVNGSTLDCKGMGGSASGKVGNKGRPKLILGDDVDPDSESNSEPKAAQNRGRFQKTILPLNINAAVMVAGTVTMYDSFIHDFVHAVKGRPKGDWVNAQGFNVHYFPAIQADGTSLWPQQWPLATLLEEKARDEYAYKLNYDNDPDPPKEMTFWTPSIFRYDSHFLVEQRVLHVDIATTTGPDADHTALVMAGRDVSQRKAVIERAVWGHFTGPQIRELIHDFCEKADGPKPLVRVERNQGGDLLLDALGPWPIGVRYETTRPGASKEDRIRWAHQCYHARAVSHLWKDRKLEEELCLWPRGTRDDLPDALAGALGWCFRKPWAMS
jgi:hypothetical protein